VSCKLACAGAHVRATAPAITGQNQQCSQYMSDCSAMARLQQQIALRRDSLTVETAALAGSGKRPKYPSPVTLVVSDVGRDGTPGACSPCPTLTGSERRLLGLLSAS
jgi:hypothetical protein